MTCGVRIMVGKIYALVTSDTPRLFKKFNHRIVWGDGSKGPAKLEVKTYLSGSNASLDSWVILMRSDRVSDEDVGE